MKAKSSRHHYIPKFVLNGFTNSTNQLYIYDKDKDEINIRPRSPKSIFFDEHRNTVNFNGIESSSLIEDEFYCKVDNESAKLIKSFQEDEITDELLSIENQGKFQFFLINLFWRLPLTDYAVRNLLKRADIKTSGVDPEGLRNDENFHKIQRFGLYRYTIDLINEKPSPKLNYYVKMCEFEPDLFVIGDNPVLFRSTPKEFTDLNYMDFMFAVSSKRTLISTLDEFGKFTLRLGYDFNVMIIDQSIRYIASGNYKLLEDSVNYYRKLKEANLLFGIKELMFRKK